MVPSLAALVAELILPFLPLLRICGISPWQPLRAFFGESWRLMDWKDDFCVSGTARLQRQLARNTVVPSR